MDVSTALFAAKVKLKGFNALGTPDDSRCVLVVVLEVKNVAELNSIKNKLIAIPDVLEARRGQS